MLASIAARVYWWLGSYNDAYSAENANFLTSHRLADGVLHCCTGLSVDDAGRLAPPPSFLTDLIAADRSARVGPVYVPVAPSVVALQSGAAADAVPAIVAWAVRANVSLLSDYEPHANTTAAHARRYADYLGALASALHAKDRKLVVCISDWGILGPAYWHALAAAGADLYASMGSTYFHKGPADAYGRAIVDGMLTAFPRESVVVGIGSAAPRSCPPPCVVDDYKWTEASLSSFLQFLQARRVGAVAVWLTDIAALLAKQPHYCGVEPWMLPPLEAFRSGGAAEASDRVASEAAERGTKAHGLGGPTAPRSSPRAGVGKAGADNMTLRASTLGFGNVLPQHRWMCKTDGGEFNPSGYCRVGRTPNYVAHAPRWPNGRGACAVENDPLCPDYTYIGTWSDARTKTLPYTVQDTYDRAQTPTSVPVLTLSNGAMHATITPQWGGRVWGLAALGSGGMSELVYRNLYFQPNNDALRQAYTQGGIEWNFGTQIGHASQTQDPVWAAVLPTKEHGDVLRLYSYERISGSVWQVDLMLEGAALFAHVKLTPRLADIDAYFWTNVAVHNDDDGATEMRILTPATGFVSDDGLSAIAPWPRFYERSLGTGADDRVSHDGDFTYPTYPKVPYASPLDHSYPYLWWEKRDVWFTATPDRTVRYNGWVDRSGSTFLHGHPGNGTKAWVWGTSPNERYWQRFGSANAHEVPLQNFTYTELQAGVMPTQYQGFPIPLGASHEWTEVFTTLGDAGREPATLASLRSADYHGQAIPTVDAWMDAAGIGSKNSSAFDAADAFLAALADTPVEETQLVARGEAYGGLDGLRLGEAGGRLTPGTLFPTDRLSREERPWAELLWDGTFSNESTSAHPTSFMVDAGWMDLLRASAASRGSTWLHHLHLATGELERAEVPGDAHFEAAAASFEASLRLRVSAEALRGVALIQSSARNFSAATAAYRRALDLALDPNDPDPAGATLLLRNLPAEFAQFLVLTYSWDALQALVADSRLPPASRAQDRFRIGEAHAAYQRKEYAVLFRLLDCAPERQWPTLGYDLHGLMALYQSAVVEAAAAAKGSALTVLERNAALRARPVPVCLRAVGH